MKIIRGKVYDAIPKHHVTLNCDSGKIYEFSTHTRYMCRIYILNYSQIIVNNTKITVNTSWLADNFKIEKHIK
jgi:hypothetical protein